MASNASVRFWAKRLASITASRSTSSVTWRSASASSATSSCRRVSPHTTKRAPASWTCACPPASSASAALLGIHDLDEVIGLDPARGRAAHWAARTALSTCSSGTGAGSKERIERCRAMSSRTASAWKLDGCMSGWRGRIRRRADRGARAVTRRGRERPGGRDVSGQLSRRRAPGRGVVLLGEVDEDHGVRPRADHAREHDGHLVVGQVAPGPATRSWRGRGYGPARSMSTS